MTLFIIFVVILIKSLEYIVRLMVYKVQLNHEITLT